MGGRAARATGSPGGPAAANGGGRATRERKAPGADLPLVRDASLASGYRGVTANGSRFKAHFQSKYLGTFESAEEAARAYARAAEDHKAIA
jgi:hypothetical protein